jgi:hypothetical protein
MELYHGFKTSELSNWDKLPLQDRILYSGTKKTKTFAKNVVKRAREIMTFSMAIDMLMLEGYADDENVQTVCRQG